jgi:hypothetical protein
MLVSLRHTFHATEPQGPTSGPRKVSFYAGSRVLSFAEQEISDLGLQHPDEDVKQGEALFTPCDLPEGMLYMLKKGRVGLEVSRHKHTRR